MFYGTTFIFRILYFITSMIPAYLLFSISFLLSFFDLNNFTIENICKNMHIGLIVIFVLLVLLVIFPGKLKNILINSTSEKSGGGFVRESTSIYKVVEYNGETISYLLGVIFPSIIVFKESMWITLLVFLFLQITIYKLIMNTSQIFPNVFMIVVMRMNVLKCIELNEKKFDNQIYVLYFDTKDSKPFVSGYIQNVELTKISENPGEVYICYV